MICFDTMVLVWGVQGAATTGQEEMIARTRRYISSLRAQNDLIMIPTPALAEYLQGFDTDERKRQLQVLERHFFIPAFNLPAAYLAAGLARNAAHDNDTIPRQTVKTDIQILATAIVSGATQLVTHEKAHFERLAAGRIEILEVPNVHEQEPLDYDA